MDSINNIGDLFSDVSKYGNVELMKNGIRAFVLLMTGENLSNARTLMNIGKLCSEAVGEYYPNIEAMKNDDGYFLLILTK